MDLQVFFIQVFLPFLFTLLLLVELKKRSTSKKNQSLEPPLPPGPWRLPLVGHLHHLVGKLAHRAFCDLAAKYGPVMLVKIGQVDVVVISSPEAAEEVLTTHDRIFAYRPEINTIKVISYDNTNIAFAPYGSYWKQMRKACNVGVLGVKRVKSLAATREEEIFSMLREIAMAPPTVAINLSKKLETLSCNVMSRAVVGKKFKSDEESFLPVMKEVMETLSGFSFSDTFPSFKFIDDLTGTSSWMKRIRQKFDEMLDEIIKQHQVKKALQLTSAGNMDNAEEDLLDLLLRMKEDGDLEVPLTFDNIKAVVLDMFLGGTDTSATTMEWAISELIRNPEVMKKAQNEVREALKGRTKVEESDVEGLKYLKLVIKEVLRLHPPGPFTVPRVAKESCTILGFNIPNGTRVLINAWAMGRDPRYWDDAESFKPERFDQSMIEFKGRDHFEYIPFGGGRRVCPGMDFALAKVGLVLANLLFYFDWGLPNGMKPENLDMTERVGGVASRENELYLLATPCIRLP
ncbi:premnaspirodiene oxygenase-like [Canna indica]|uniref:Premnaspirodiene oxygenase-like n=1 Tax=Canna indica TaxID=4628 RepID=A0AAQ3JWR0_9LILI|nr:premnaspirodiene oxygenase-like [Canna indica]